MKPRILIVPLALMANLGVLAGDLQQELRASWLGAWVVTTVDTYSDCGGLYTNNRINGKLVRSNGTHRFTVGELARLDNLDLKRSRVDLKFSLTEPILHPSASGPFTLYGERSCRVELEVEIPRSAVKTRQLAAIDSALQAVLERHATEDGALDSALWNSRERADYPDDYEATLRAHAVWQAEQRNHAVRDQLDRAELEPGRLADRLTTEPSYLEGFVHGVEQAKSNGSYSCSQLMAINLDRPVPKPGRDETPEQQRGRSGQQDGLNLIYSLEMIRQLPDCFVEVPE